MAIKPDPGLINMKRTRHQVDFAIPADYRVKIKETQKLVKYLLFAREKKKTVEHGDHTDSSHS